MKIRFFSGKYPIFLSKPLIFEKKNKRKTKRIFSPENYPIFENTKNNKRKETGYFVTKK
jgi:hypothetical protein